MACGHIACCLIASYRYVILHIMDTQEQPTERIIRTTLTISETLDRGLRDLADKNGRPLSWEYRRAIEAHLAANAKDAA